MSVHFCRHTSEISGIQEWAICDHALIDLCVTDLSVFNGYSALYEFEVQVTVHRDKFF